mmetsp:Transcript_48042/g.124796  ORF Transcript_48042/g.124796 Transcript_48042/m.124796 type:complete len:441 (-) Transcript_48042:167-1489(-)
MAEEKTRPDTPVDDSLFFPPSFHADVSEGSENENEKESEKESEERRERKGEDKDGGKGQVEIQQLMAGPAPPPPAPPLPPSMGRPTSFLLRPTFSFPHFNTLLSGGGEKEGVKRGEEREGGGRRKEEEREEAKGEEEEEEESGGERGRHRVSSTASSSEIEVVLPSPTTLPAWMEGMDEDEKASAELFMEVAARYDIDVDGVRWIERSSYRMLRSILSGQMPLTSDSLVRSTLVFFIERGERRRGQEGGDGGGNTENGGGANTRQQKKEGGRANRRCDICMCNHRAKDMTAWGPCKHTYCKACLKKMCNMKITEGAVLDLRCPDPSCRTIITREVLREVVSDDVFDVYENQVRMMHDPNMRSCPHCGCVQGGNKKKLQVKCQHCDGVYCFLHGDAHPYREGMSKEEWGKECKAMEKEGKRAKKDFQKWAKSHAKFCPKCR